MKRPGRLLVVAFGAALITFACIGVTPLEPGLATGGEAGESSHPVATGGASSGGLASGGTAGRDGGPSVSGGNGGTSSGGVTGEIGGTSSGGRGGTEVDGGAGFGGECRPETTGTCHFEFLGGNEFEYQRCDDGASRTLGGDYERVDGATSLADCEAACLARADCVAISDYFDEPGLDRCYIATGSCDDPRKEIHSEENAAKVYRKACPAGGECQFEYLGHFMLCESDGDVEVIEGATSTRDCEEACLGRADCTYIVDYFWLREIIGCYLFTGACCSTEPLPYGDLGKAYRKVCD